MSLSTREDSDAVPTRVLIRNDQCVFATEETKTVVMLSDLFDVSQDVPAGAASDATAALTIGFQRGESRETATIECRAQKLAKAQLVLFKLLLGGTTVTLTQTGDTIEIDEGGERATLEIHSEGVGFDCESGRFELARSDIERFNTTKSEIGGQSDLPTVVLYSHQNGQITRTGVCLPSFRVMNLFGRYLQTSPDAGFDESAKSVPDTIDVLLVDDDPGDLETTELMLKQHDDRVAVTTATSAAGGIERLAEESFDCIVSDYSMPGTDGIEFLQAVRERDPDLPFVLFTGQGSEAVAKQALLSEVTDYVEKGFATKQYEILAERVRKAVR